MAAATVSEYLPQGCEDFVRVPREDAAFAKKGL